MAQNNQFQAMQCMPCVSRPTTFRAVGPMHRPPESFKDLGSCSACFVKLPKQHLKSCSKCTGKVAKYCSRKCQVCDWRARHKTNCQLGSQAANASEAIPVDTSEPVVFYKKRGALEGTQGPWSCSGCSKTCSEESVLLCPKCTLEAYCSEECQIECRESHKFSCEIICKAEKSEEAPVFKVLKHCQAQYSSEASPNQLVPVTGFEGMRPCSNCKKMFPEDTILFCSDCNVQTYHSKDCQQKHWKSHKTSCRVADLTLQESKKALSKLLDILMWHSDWKLFIDEENGNRLIDLATLAREKSFQDEGGPGILIIFFGSRPDCESMAGGLAQCLNHKKRTGGCCLECGGLKHPSLPTVVYVRYPFQSNNDRLVLSMLELNIGSIMSNCGQDQFVLGVAIRYPEPGALEIRSLPYSTFHLPRQLMGKSMLKIKGTVLADNFSELILNEQYHECRRAMVELRLGRQTGFLWLRNIFTREPCFSSRDLKKITPDNLLDALQMQHKESSSMGQPDSIDDCVAVYFTLKEWKTAESHLKAVLASPDMKKCIGREMSDPNNLVAILFTSEPNDYIWRGPYVLSFQIA